MQPAVTYHLKHVDKHTGARLGEIVTPHGTFPTPMFMPVGTQASVKTLSPEELDTMGAGIILANTYHLWLRPGEDLIEEAGGLHQFMNWHKGLLTDSGGFQVFSLADMRNITEEGVHFKNHLNGANMFLSPEKAIAIENALGPDIMMSFDECPPFFLKATITWPKAWPARAAGPSAAWRRTSIPTTRRCLALSKRRFKDLRQQSARDLVSLDFPGYSIGGLSVGESKEEMNHVLDFTTPLLPADKRGT